MKNNERRLVARAWLHTVKGYVREEIKARLRAGCGRQHVAETVKQVCRELIKGFPAECDWHYLAAKLLPGDGARTASGRRVEKILIA